jgi:anti-sigma regulatory factor (Ser/Thr protein kinase)
MDHPLEHPHHHGAWTAFLAGLTGRRVLVALVLAVLVALLLNPIFITPLPVLLGRTLFLAMVLLVVFTAAGQWPARWLPRWMPRWVAQLIAVGLAAPLATFLVYLLSVGGDVRALFANEARVSGFLWIASLGLSVGLVLALGALYRERDAQARSQELQFALERSTLERQALDARLNLLQAQIEPHFLFNTLANVQELVESGSPRAAPVLQSLIDYLRAAMPRLHNGEPTLGNEEALVRAYLQLMHMRMPDRLQVSIDIDPTLRELRFPAMALLTLVENAVRHGIDPSVDGGRIEVGARREGDAVRAWVSDSGVGLDENAAPGMGLANLRARLQGYYGAGATLELLEERPRGLRAELRFVPESKP